MTGDSLKGKVALVTGAGTPIGLGRHIAQALARDGAHVAMLDINESGLEQAAADVRAESDESSVLPLVADVTDPDAVERAVERTAAELGGEGRSATPRAQRTGAMIALAHWGDRTWSA